MFHFKTPFSFLVKLQLQRRISPAVSGSKTDKIVAAGIHDPYPVMDFRTIIQSIAIRLFVDRNAVLHLCNHRNAGTYSRAPLGPLNYIEKDCEREKNMRSNFKVRVKSQHIDHQNYDRTHLLSWTFCPVGNE